MHPMKRPDTMHDDDDDMLDDSVPAPPPPPSQWVYTRVALWEAPPSPTSPAAPANRVDILDDELLPPAPPSRSRAVPPPPPFKSPRAAVHPPPAPRRIPQTPCAVIELSDSDDEDIPSVRPAPAPPRRPLRVPRKSAVEASDEELARQLQAEWDMMDAAEAVTGVSSSRMDDEALARQLQAEWASSAASASSMTPPPPLPPSASSSPFTPVRPPPAPLASSSPTKTDDVASIIAKTTPDSRVAFADEGPLLKLHERFMYYNYRYFGGKLSACEVRWSPRMTLCAGQCHYRPQERYCSVRLSVPLLQYRPKQDGIDTLLHEMIHAYLFVTDGNDDHDGHGTAFHEWMHKLNAVEPGANISVFHTFRDEVNAARKHVWKCNGPCKDRPPYFGIVRRSMNRAPQPADRWWADHKRTCGGTYTKIQGPDIDANGNSIPKPASRRARKSDPGEGRRLGMADEDDPDPPPPPPPPPPAKRARTTKPKPAADDGKQKSLDGYLLPPDPTSPGILMAAGRKKKVPATAAENGSAVAKGAPAAPPAHAAVNGGPAPPLVVGDSGDAQPVLPPLPPGLMGGGNGAPAMLAPPAPPRLKRPAFVDLTWSEEDKD
ncbi:hypothetical protein AMAG_08537 [Allomyces macrogynus ATCC 38327]|uniref:SprT-like domain-containing protein n=1 Tax=Allomyces macrogynus (strain ATCC 38327) TaxID=578462 RepID=A0A0L0SLZ3_ALLM3|nr:hypothetical protein AMAG_08537 [Allomyces macrogynus ATCC 38327]|eukprot:KNE63405.1 hypothetical protein AMAG_08537 [Allomyces macrogynus ATCC 38327]